jgi:DNA-binding NtrC family response regulator
VIPERQQSAVGVRKPLTLKQILEAYERIILIKAIQTCGGSRTVAAASLGVRRGYLYGRLRHLSIALAEIPCRQGRPPKNVGSMTDGGEHGKS